MADELDVLAGLSPEQIVERAKALALEVAYWQQVIADCETVNGAVLAGTTAVLDGTQTALALLPFVTPAQLPLVEQIVESQREALRALKAIVDALDRTLELADGRRKSLEPVADVLLRAAGEAAGDDSEPAA
jgi:hypothetical protein